MLGTATLDAILNPASSDETILAALAGLQLPQLDLALLSDAIQRIRQTAAVSDDLSRELQELGQFAIDCSGTGGSGMNHFNTSTSTAFVLAAAGFKVAKFGGRAASGRSGSFDFLESLGLETQLPLPQVADALNVCGLAFIYAPEVYPGLKRLAPLRKQFGKPTLFNYVGPLLNPLRPTMRMMGISSDQARDLVAEHLRQDERTKRALLVTAGGRLDELAIDTVNQVTMIDGNARQVFQFKASTTSPDSSSAAPDSSSAAPDSSSAAPDSPSTPPASSPNSSPATASLSSASTPAASSAETEGKQRPDSLNNRAMRMTQSGINLKEIANTHADQKSIQPEDSVPDSALKDKLSSLPEIDPARSSRIFMEIVNGEDTSSPYYKMLLLNVAGGLFVLKACSSIAEGIGVAEALIADGKVYECVATCRRFYARLSN